jgi:hypothetical protein
MKQTVSSYVFKDAFCTMDRVSNFPGNGLDVLFDYIEQYEEETGEEIELDVIALCCDYSQSSFEEVERDYRIEVDYSDCETEEEREEARRDQVLEYLNENTSVVGECNADEVIFAKF